MSYYSKSAKRTAYSKGGRKSTGKKKEQKSAEGTTYICELTFNGK